MNTPSAVAILFLATISVIHAAEPPLPAKVEFNRDVRPILSENCFACHGPDKSFRKADLRLDIREEAMSGKAFIPGQPEMSAMIERVLADNTDERMPPADSNKQLTERQKEILQRWIAQGAEYQQHWAYVNPMKAKIPSDQNGIDALVQKRLTEVGLKASPEADRRTLIRRLYSDLLGLPPTPEEVQAFQRDTSPGAWEQLADQVLQNPHYGERMAIGWLDVVRYADTIGYHSDTPWLGQTTGCAQCHDHKFDPFTSRDFYSLGAFFADIDEPILGRREDGMTVLLAEDEKQLAKLDALVAEAKRMADPAVSEGEALENAERQRKVFYDALPKCIVSSSSSKPRTVRLLPRGNWMDETGEIMQPALPHYLPQPKIEGRKLTRLDLPEWLVSGENPLTARAMMNRLWKQFFGMGLSRVLDDLGAQGDPPLNPALLDWLACEFMDSGWDVKHMVRTIVTSETYRQVSTATPQLLAADPYNREHARQSAFRIDAELVRDNALAIAGLLVPKIGGASVKPWQPAGYWENLNFPTRQYIADIGENQYRRGLYTWWQRSFLHPSLLAFDAPSREECCAERNRSSIPQQALVLLNDPTYVEAAHAFAIRILSECKGSPEDKITWAWQQALQRDPGEVEMRTVVELLEKHVEIYSQNPDAAVALLSTGNLSVTDPLDKSELAAWTHIARVLLNLHETITRS